MGPQGILETRSLLPRAGGSLISLGDLWLDGWTLAWEKARQWRVIRRFVVVVSRFCRRAWEIIMGTHCGGKTLSQVLLVIGFT